jgi:hypothetical protein
MFLLSLFFRLIEGPTKPLIQCLLVSILAELRRWDREADYSPPSSTEVYNMQAPPPYSSVMCRTEDVLCFICHIVCHGYLPYSVMPSSSCPYSEVTSTNTCEIAQETF